MAQAQFAHPGTALVINEIQAANHGTFTDELGRTPDWIELYNPNDHPLDLLGLRVAITGEQHLIDGPLRIPAFGHRLLWCDARPELGPDHLDFVLPREGGTVLLIATDGSTFIDLFTYPRLTSDLSIGRAADGSKAWSFFAHPTPGSANVIAAPVCARANAPIADHVSGMYEGPFGLQFDGPGGAVIRYTLDGSEPTETHGMVWNAPLVISSNTVVRARAFAVDALPSAEFVGNYFIGGPGGEAIALTVAPAGLWNDTTGIYATGLRMNHTRSGPLWERPAYMQWIGHDTAAVPLGIRISGSGSRGLAKRSFKLYARDRYDGPEKLSFADGVQCDEAMLRADAVSNAFLHNLLLETVVRTGGLELEVQTSEPAPLYLNGQYWGLYRRMPPKDAQWLKAISGARALDILEGPNATVRSGSDEHFQRALHALRTGAPMDTLAALIDLESLIDLACVDLYTARVDQDLNVRCFRPRTAEGRWRWVLFDMDLWAPANENTVERLCEVTQPETPYARELLAHPELRVRLLARLAALQATVLSEDRLDHLADSLHHRYEAAIRADHRRWADELERPDPDALLGQLKDFIAQRPAWLMAHLSAQTGMKRLTVTLEAPPAAQGTLLLEGLPLPPGRTDVAWFADVPMHLEVVPGAGFEMAGWKGSEEVDVQLTLDGARVRQARPVLRAEGLSRQDGLQQRREQ
jgi:hypothetical protein